MTEWQPIRTAPKDGTIIDLWCGGRRRPDCRWQVDPDDPHSEYGWVQAYSEAPECWTIIDIDETPTYWMPRPPDPE